MIDKQAGLKGLVLRPLSAKFLELTVPEQEGIVRRDALHGIIGRSRKPQMALARKLGLTDYPAPAGGCLLTEPNYAFRLKELLSFSKDPCFKDINLLRVGRHFRFSPECKIIVGRNEKDNEALLSLTDPDDYVLHIEGVGSPETLISGKVTDYTLSVAASLCARYSGARHLSEATASVSAKGEHYSLKVHPALDETLDMYRIEMKQQAEIEKIRG